MRRGRWLAAAALGLVIGAVGCSGEKAKYVHVSGVVRLNQKPYPNAAVFFQPVGSKDDPNPGRGSAGVTDTSGRYVLMCEGREGAVVGTHQVKVVTNEANLFSFNPETGSPDDVGPLQNKGKIDPIPPDWRELGKHTFDVPPGGTKEANFDIENPKWKN